MILSKLYLTPSTSQKKKIDKLLDYEDVVLLFMSPNDLTSFEQEYINKYHEIHDKKDEPNEN